MDKIEHEFEVYQEFMTKHEGLKPVLDVYDCEEVHRHYKTDGKWHVLVCKRDWSFIGFHPHLTAH